MMPRGSSLLKPRLPWTGHSLACGYLVLLLGVRVSNIAAFEWRLEVRGNSKRRGPLQTMPIADNVETITSADSGRRQLYR